MLLTATDQSILAAYNSVSAVIITEINKKLSLFRLGVSFAWEHTCCRSVMQHRLWSVEEYYRSLPYTLNEILTCKLFQILGHLVLFVCLLHCSWKKTPSLFYPAPPYLARVPSCFFTSEHHSLTSTSCLPLLLQSPQRAAWDTVG